MKKTKYILGILFIILIDQISKIIIMKNIPINKSVTVIKNFFKLTYTHNNGAAFGLFGGKIIFILIISFIVLSYLLYELFNNKKKPKMLNIGTVLLIGGLIGNLIDRIYFGYVRDFFDFTIFNYDFAIFNIGDISIVVGALLFFIAVIKEEKRCK